MSNFGHLQPVATSRLRAEAATAGLGATPTNALRASRDTATYNAAIAPPRPGEAPSEAEARIRAAGLQLLAVPHTRSVAASAGIIKPRYLARDISFAKVTRPGVSLISRASSVAAKVASEFGATAELLALATAVMLGLLQRRVHAGEI